MTIKKVWCLLVLAAVLLPVKGFPEVTSRIQGVVKDFNTGEPIGGATLILLYSSDYSNDFVKHYEWFTDDKGSFRFSLLKKGFYYLCVYKKGYADFGPFFEYEFKVAAHSSYDTSTFTVKRSSHENHKILLKEGEIKHVEIKLKKEAIIEIKFNRKTMNGIEPLTFEIFPGYTHPEALTNFSADISFVEDKNKTIWSEAAKKDVGIIVFKSLPPGYKVRVNVRASGYPSKMYNITLEEGKTHIIDHLLDFTTGQVVYGIITDKNTGKPLIGVRISLSKIGIERESIYFHTDSTGKYWLGGFSPGKYRMYITLTSSGKEIFIPLEIKENQKIEINRQF
jgi:hypothetical protein